MPARKLAILASFLFLAGLLLTVAAYAVTHS
jgi:hypothetical protein